MGVAAGAGGALYVCMSLPPTDDWDGFYALEWTEVGGVIEIPNIGIEYEVFRYTLLSNSVEKKLHGDLNCGSFQLPLAYDVNDPGQAILEWALAEQKPIAFREVQSDNVTRYFVGKVMGFRTGIAIGAVVSASSDIEIATVHIHKTENWILAHGFWDDLAFWLDGEVWID